MKVRNKTINRFDKPDLYFLIFILMFFIVSLFLLNTPPTADEGTHSLISLFFRDLFRDLAKHPTFSFSDIYNYAISYLVHYPKLSLYYPPLLHITTSFFFGFLEVSFFTARLVVLIFSIGTLLVMYKAIGKFFNKKIALLVTVLFSIMPMIYYNSITMMTDIPYMFFFMTAMFFYLTALDSRRIPHFILAAIFTSLAFFTKWNSILILPIIFVYILLEKRVLMKYFIISALLVLLIISPYILIVWKAGLITLPYISSLQTSATAKQDPQFTTVQGWIYYSNVLSKQYFTIPLLIAALGALILYSIKREKYWKLFVIWFLTYYIVFTVLSNKEPRYMIPLVPTLLIPLSVFILSQKTKISVPLMVVGIALVSFTTAQLIYSTYYYNPDFVEIAKETLNDEGNILVAAEPSWFYSSQFIFTLASLDENLSKFVYRSCSLSSTSLDDLSSTYGVNYIIVPEPTDRDSDNVLLVKSSPNLVLEKEFQTDTTKISLFVSNTSSQKQYCNFICVLNTTICTNHRVPIEAFK